MTARVYTWVSTASLMFVAEDCHEVMVYDRKFTLPKKYKWAFIDETGYVSVSIKRPEILSSKDIEYLLMPQVHEYILIGKVEAISPIEPPKTVVELKEIVKQPQRIVQLLSHADDLYGLCETGDVYFENSRGKWQLYSLSKPQSN
jgi:hypothetical protein